MNESFTSYDSRFDAQMSRYITHGQTIRMDGSAYAFILLKNANMDDNQCV